MECCIAGDDRACVIAKGRNLLVLIGVRCGTGIDQFFPKLEVIGQDLHIIKAQALVVLCEQGDTMLTHPVVQQVGVDERRAAEAVLAGLFP